MNCPRRRQIPLVAYVDGDRLAWCGWPPGEALLTDCELVKSCSDAESLDLLKAIASPNHQDKRGRMARLELEALASVAGKGSR